MSAELDNWRAELDQFRDASIALAIGVFTGDGEPVYLNRGMSALLADAEPATRAFINPSFAQLFVTPGFEGLITVGDGYRVNRSIKAAVLRKAGQILIAGEIDVLELEHFNRELSRANQQINNLQRELIKKNRLIEAHLTELQRTQAMLVHAEKMSALGQLVAGVAHEINNPLGFVLGNVQSLEEMLEHLSTAYLSLDELAQPQLGSEVTQSIRATHDVDYLLDDCPALLRSTLEGLQRIKRLVDDLRSFSRLHEAARKSVDIRAGIESVLALVAAQMKKQGIELRIDFEDMPPFDCYPGELNQVFMNLIVNAMQAMEHGGVLRVSGRIVGNELQLIFEDDGTGIAPENLAKIFEPFFTTKPVGGGTGLGLAIAYSIVNERHGGRIEVQSTPGEGARFMVCLPTRTRSRV